MSSSEKTQGNIESSSEKMYDMGRIIEKGSVLKGVFVWNDLQWRN